MIKNFPKKALKLLYCPCGEGELSLVSDIKEEQVINGEVICSLNSSHKYQITGGILKLMPKDGDLDEYTQSEIKARDNQAGGYDERLSSRFDKELPSTLKIIGSVDGKKVIEYGCGTGRITSHLFGAELLVALDFSCESLNILAQKSKDQQNLALIQSGVTTIKIKPKTFDLAVSIQVVEHIPNIQMRTNFFKLVTESLVQDGIFVLSIYHFDLRRKIKKKPKIGKHASGIAYHYFNKTEIKKEMKPFFDFCLVKNIDITWPLESRFKLDRLLGKLLSELGEKIPIINSLGHLVLVKAKKKSNSVHYQWGLFYNRFLVKHWFWFANPRDIIGVGMVNFFSYEDIDSGDFHKKEGMTTVVNLNKTEEEIFGSFRNNFVQKQIRRGERNQIKIEHNQDFKSFRNLYKEFRKTHRLPKERIDPLEEVADIFLAYYKNKLIAGGLFLIGHNIVRVWALASLTKTRDLFSREIIGQANRMVLWEAMKYAKSVGCSEFDLGGISPNSSNKHMRTLAEFKEAFGGERRKSFYYYKIYSPIIKLWMKFRGFKNT